MSLAEAWGWTTLQPSQSLFLVRWVLRMYPDCGPNNLIAANLEVGEIRFFLENGTRFVTHWKLATFYHIKEISGLVESPGHYIFPYFCVYNFCITFPCFCLLSLPA